VRILITGANRGLGLALSQIGAERGHHIFAGVRDVAQVEDKCNFNHAVTILPIDVTDEDSVSNAAKIIKVDLGMIDVIINNAGVLVDRDKKIEELDISRVQTTFDVNLFGPMRVVKHFLPLLMKSDSASIINISSEAGSFENAYGGDYPYATSKTALNMFSEQLSKYVNGKNTQVYAVHPGWMKTDMGGERAPGNPFDTANSIFDIIERKLRIDSKHVFITKEGKPMPI
jgi:NAD(P)-dependent dehydrogenase (short-subunit alcohol dehydrogenase family)